VVLARLPDPAQWIGKAAANTPILKTVLAQQEGTSENTAIFPIQYGNNAFNEK
jgi:hypothetical protein